MTPSDTIFLWDLSKSDNRVRYQFIEQSLDSPEAIERFNRRVDLAVQAAVGLDVRRREYTVARILLPRLRRHSDDWRQRLASARIGQTLLMDDSELIRLSAKAVVDTLTEQGDTVASTESAELLNSILNKLDPADARETVELLARAVRQGTGPSTLQVLGRGLHDAAQKVPSADRPNVSASLVAALESTEMAVLPDVSMSERSSIQEVADGNDNQAV